MPTYDYKCWDCDTTTELVLSIQHTEVPECKTCGAEMTKLFSAPPVHFKGTGWGSKPQLWTKSNRTGKVEKYKGDIKPGYKGPAEPRYS